MITAKELARELNLSQSTISRILNGDRHHRVSEATRQRVLEGARLRNYQPNAIARSLRRGRTDIVGLYTYHDYDARNDFLGAVIGGLQRACGLHGLDLLLHSALRDRETEDTFASLRDGRIDGLCLHTSTDDPLLDLLRRSTLPVVAIADPLPDFASVTCDDDGGMRQLIAYLWHRGYRRFTYLAPEISLASVDRRRGAFTDDLQRRGLSEADRLVLRIGYEAAGDVLDDLLGEEGPRAVCCWNDRTAYNLLQACGTHGIQAPRDLAVAGFDGFLDNKLPAQQLTSVRCPWDHAAAAALELLIRRIEAGSGQTDSETCEIRMPTDLIQGDTA